jgi:hypothetical protein
MTEHPTLEELVAAACDRERRRQEAAACARLHRLEAQRQEAIALQQERLARCLTPEQLALLNLTWTDLDRFSGGDQIPAILRWRGHSLRLLARHTGIHVEEYRPGRNDCAEGQYLDKNIWEGLLLYLGRLPGLHGCGHVVQRGDALADLCPYCTGADVPL